MNGDQNNFALNIKDHTPGTSPRSFVACRGKDLKHPSCHQISMDQPFCTWFRALVEQRHASERINHRAGPGDDFADLLA
jgi:hypothetical protein